MDKNSADVLTAYAKGLVEYAAISSGSSDVKLSENSYYPLLQKLLKDIGGDNVHVVVDAVAQEGNKPDFTVIAENGDTIGIIEAKAIGTDLDAVVRSAQLERYINYYPNVIVTNYYEFLLYNDGNVKKYVDLREDERYTLDDFSIILSREDLVSMLNRFLSKRSTAKVDVETIAKLLADIARDELEPAIRERYNEELEGIDINNCSRDDVGKLLGAYIDLRNNLIRDISDTDFVDMYAQTVTYGLLIAKMSNECGEFSRDTATKRIPDGFGMLHSIFDYVSTGDLSPGVDTAINNIVDVLNRTEPGRVMDRYYNENRGKEWFVHFYETFFAMYNPKGRKRRGVYYTPDPVVSYITRSVNSVLKDSFKKKLGFGDESVEVLDPATGTMSFLASACQLAIDEKRNADDGDDNIDVFIRDHVLKHFYGFELEMTPYALAHLKMKALLDKNDYRFDMGRSRILLVNTLSEGSVLAPSLDHFTSMGKSIEEEAVCANKVQNRDKIIAIIGNPPYSGARGANRGMFNDELELYKTAVRGESIPHLSDDYVKFVRFAHKNVVDQGEGVIGFITNNSYLDGREYRGMREELMKSFDEIYIFNLRGHANVDPRYDKNVFKIKQGVAIAIFIKTSNTQDECKVYYSDMLGSKESKFEYLDANSIDTMRTNDDWHEIEPCDPHYYLKEMDFSSQIDYDRFLSISSTFVEISSCIKTARDTLVIQSTEEKMRDVINDFAYLGIDEARKKYCARPNGDLRADGKHWSIESAQNDLIDTGLKDEKIVRILYRPYDIRFTYYTGKSAGFMSVPGRKIMQHIKRGGMGMVVCKQQGMVGFRHAFLSDNIVDISCISNKSKESNAMCPLYRYDDNGSDIPNIYPSVIAKLMTAYGTEPTPEDIMYYIYGILYSNPYRDKYAELLKMDFPKIPFTYDYELFVKIGEIGKKLADLHLMKPDVFKTGSVKCKGSGDNVVSNVSYDGENERVIINNVRYFDGVSNDVWEYQIGSYKPAYKWLYDRKGDALTWDDIDHYMCICNAIRTTIDLQIELDVLYADVDSGVLSFDIEIASNRAVAKSYKRPSGKANARASTRADVRASNRHSKRDSTIASTRVSTIGEY